MGIENLSICVKLLTFCNSGWGALDKEWRQDSGNLRPCPASAGRVGLIETTTPTIQKGWITFKARKKLTVTIFRRGNVKTRKVHPLSGSNNGNYGQGKLFSKSNSKVVLFPVWIPSIPLVWWWLPLPFWWWWGAGLEGWLSPCSVLTLMFRCCCWGLLWPWDIPQESSTVRAASCSAGAVWARKEKVKVQNLNLDNHL